MTDEALIAIDALIIGAGPAGLFQVFELGLQGIEAHVVDSLPYAGGQCIELYPDKPIYDIPAVPVCSGRELVDKLLMQIKPFGATLHLGDEVSALRRDDDGRFRIDTTGGKRFIAKTVFVAGGVGTFQPRSLRVEGLDKYRGRQLHFQVPDPGAYTGQRLVIVGGTDDAVALACDLAAVASSVVLLHRREVLQAEEPTLARLHRLCDAGAMRFATGQVTGIDEADGRLTAVQVLHQDASVEALAIDALIVRLGLSPKLGPIADWGLNIERKQVVVDTATFETSTPGIFAVGDINAYPGKRKLIVSGFHEATLAAFAAAALVFPNKPVQLQYTTTSPKLHALLGVESPGAG